MRASLAALLVLALSAFSQPASADPAAILANLSNRSPTLLDHSMARLEGLLHADGVAGGYMAYPYVQDEKIVILAWAWSENEPGSEEICKSLLTRLRVLGGVDPETGWPLDPASVYASFFDYSSFKAYEVDQTYGETVDSMIELKVVSGIAGNDEAFICKGPLLSKTIVITRE